IQFDWNINEKNTDYLRFGAGIFGSDVNNYVTINNLTFDGKHFGTVDVTGANVPTPDFIGYRNGTVATPDLAALQIPTINTYAEDAKIPVVYKANLSYSKLINEKLRVGITGYATLARNNYMYVDRNMATNPYFTLANEGNRGVFVPAIASNGVSDWKTGRLTNQFGRVLELNSKGKVNQFAVVVDGTWQYFKDGEISASYTWNDTKDNTSFNGNVANSATLSLPVVDDPRDLSNISYSNGQFRHKVVIYGTLPTFYGVKVGFKYSGMGGTRYSLLSGANNNGDFVTTNDLAYIFDRNNPNVPERVRTGLQALLDNPNVSQSVKDYILKNEGTFAERNGGINNFFGQVDLRVSKKININKRHNIEVSADVFNFANLLSKKWGVTETLGTQALYGLGVPNANPALNVPNYDTTNRQFNYRVNNAGVINPSGNPWQIQVGLRYGF
ncbi:MAG: TonB-dependent receptor, partial [Pedobacter sp.]